MTGNGRRFKEANYSLLKPFINVHGKPILEWVIRLFKDDADNCLFICRDDHLKINYVEEEIKRIAPNSETFIVDDWQKEGPAVDILKASELIDDRYPVLVSYCDYYLHWNYQEYKNELKSRDPDGSIPCYSGFHPNLIPIKNLYASCLVDKENNLIEIKEKHSWNDDKTKDLTSPGVYYFKSGEILKTYCKKMIGEKDSVNGEYYMSLPFNYLVNDGLSVWCPSNVEKFCQWGTPEDLEEYIFWIDTIKKREVLKDEWV